MRTVVLAAGIAVLERKLRDNHITLPKRS